MYPGELFNCVFKRVWGLTWAVDSPGGGDDGVLSCKALPIRATFWRTVTLLETVCVPGNKVTIMQSSPLYPDTMASPFRTSWKELHVLFVMVVPPLATSSPHSKELSGSTVIWALQLKMHVPSLQSMNPAVICRHQHSRSAARRSMPGLLQLGGSS